MYGVGGVDFVVFPELFFKFSNVLAMNICNY